MKELPKRIDALEAENKELRAMIELLSATPQKAQGEPCKACGELAVRRKSSQPSKGPFGRLGARDEVWSCSSCEDTETRLVTD